MGHFSPPQQLPHTSATTMEAKVFFFVLFVVFSSSVAAPAPGDDPVVHLPDRENVEAAGFKMNATGNYITLMGLVMTFGAPGQVTLAGDGMDYLTKHYQLDGEMMGLHVVGDGDVKMTLQGSLGVTYTPVSGSKCATAGTTKYSVTCSSVDAHITGVKAGSLDGDKFTNLYLDNNPGKVGDFLTSSLNGFAHDVFDKVVVELINQHCKSPQLVLEAALEQLLESS